MQGDGENQERRRDPECDVVLSAAGVVSNIENIGLEECGIVHDRGKIVVDDYYATNIPGYYAIGDCVPGPALAHVASAEGITCVEKLQDTALSPLTMATFQVAPIASPKWRASE